MMQARPLQQPRVVGGLQGLPIARRWPVTRPSAASRTECAYIPEHKEITKATALGAAVSTLLAAGSVQAAQEVAVVADSDNRLAGLLFFLVPAVGWVLFNILGPAQNQLRVMSGKKPKAAVPKPQKNVRRKRGVVAGLGLAASGLLAVQSADAATMVGQVAEADNRLAGLLVILVPAIGWVLFNILDPAKNQYDTMAKRAK